MTDEQIRAIAEKAEGILHCCDGDPPCDSAEQVEHTQDRIDIIAAAISEAVEQARRESRREALEQAGYQDVGNGPQCRVCWQKPSDKRPHVPTCWLGRALSDEPGKP